MLFRFLQCKSHHLYCYDFIRCMSDTLAWCRTERWNLSFLNLSSGSNWKFTGGNVYFFLGSARPLFSLPHKFLLLLSTSRSSPVMNESMFCSQSTSTQKWWGSVGEYKSMRGNQTVVPGRRWLSINPTVMGEGNCWSWWWTSLHSPFFLTFLGHWFLIAWCRLLIVFSVYQKLSSNIPSSLAPYLLQVYATISRKSKHNILMMISCSIIPWHTAVGRLYSSECQRRKCSLRSHL